MLAICVAHIIRVYRWELFIKIYDKPNKRNLLQAMSIGYLLNFILPFKLGDLARALIAGRKMKNGFGFALATVIIDRCLDIIVVGGVFAILFFANPNKTAAGTSLMYIGTATLIIISAAIAWVNRKLVKKSIKLIASIFNEKIEFKALKFFWSVIWGFMDIVKRISKVRILLYTACMWGLYMISYACFAKFLTTYSTADVSWTDIFIFCLPRIVYR